VYAQYVFFCSSASSSAESLDWDLPIAAVAAMGWAGARI
jgi:hypothetical protein